MIEMQEGRWGMGRPSYVVELGGATFVFLDVSSFLPMIVKK